MKNIYQKFGKYYDQIYSSFYDYKLECDNLEELFRKFCKKQPREILDIGCGTGSHAIELSKRGYNLSGIDISPGMVEQAKRKARDAKVEIDFQIQDMKSLDFPSKFDAAICMFGGFGYLITEDDYNEFLTRLKGALKKDSPFLFEFWNIGGVKPGFKNWIKTRDSEGNTLIRLNGSDFNNKTNIISVSFDFYVLSETEIIDSFKEVHRLRCFSIEEIEELLANNGFKLLGTYKKDTHTQKLEDNLEDAFNVIAVASTL